MAIEDKGTKGDEADELASLPSSVTLTSFTLKRSEKPGPTRIKAFSKAIDIENPQRSLKLRPWMLFDQIVDLEKLETKHLDTSISLVNPLPKGVIRGCSSCNDCQKIISHWHPEALCRPILDSAPVFHPTEEEFKNTLEYIAKIRPKAEQYGICSIVPPDSWRPHCPIKETNVWENSKFHTRVQKIDELQSLLARRKLKKIMEILKGKRTSIMESDYGSDGFEFESGPEFTLQAFEAYAQHFEGHYFQEKDMTRIGVPTWEHVEGEYWRVIQNPTAQIEVLSGHNLEAKVLGSGFPSVISSAGDDETQYIESGWNLNNTAKLPGSLLAFESGDISAPRLDVGMRFSSICWEVEEHHLYLLSYIHLGSQRIWYGVPGGYYNKCKAALKKFFPELSGRRELFHKLVTQLSPSTLKSEGIPVYRCIQNPAQFVLVFPGAYYSVFDSGFNVSEKVNVAPLDWLPHGNFSNQMYSEMHRKTSISYEKMLIEAVKNTLKALWLLKLPRESEQWKNACGPQGLLTRALKSHVKQERLSREYLCVSSQSQKMENEFDSSIKRECGVCYCDLHLSAAFCPCSPAKYACLLHSQELCTCPWSSKIFVFRYGLDELHLLVDALEGKLHALYTWAKGHREFFFS